MTRLVPQLSTDGAAGGSQEADAKAAAHRPLLDGFRGLAILLVIAHHALAGPDDPYAPVLERIVVGLAGSLWIGVDCFFVLSGFLITGILVDTRGRERAIRNFLARRVLRTFPLYYAVVFVSFVVLPAVLGPGFLRDLSTRQAWFWLHVSNFYSILHNVLAADGPPVGWMSTFWSLSVEEHFYLAWALVVAAVTPRRLGAVALAAFGGTLGLRVGLALSPYGDAIYRCTFTRLDALLLGSLLALWSRRPGGLGQRTFAAFVVGGLSLAAFGVTEDASFLGQTLRYSFAALLFASLFVLTLAAERDPGALLHRVLSRRSLRACGKHSYAMYVFNKPILAGIGLIFARTRLPLFIGYGATMFAYYALAVLLSFAVAFASWHLLEKHFLALKKHFA